MQEYKIMHTVILCDSIYHRLIRVSYEYFVGKFPNILYVRL